MENPVAHTFSPVTLDASSSASQPAARHLKISFNHLPLPPFDPVGDFCCTESIIFALPSLLAAVTFMLFLLALRKFPVNLVAVSSNFDTSIAWAYHYHSAFVWSATGPLKMSLHTQPTSRRRSLRLQGLSPQNEDEESLVEVVDLSKKHAAAAKVSSHKQSKTAKRESTVDEPQATTSTATKRLRTRKDPVSKSDAGNDPGNNDSTSKKQLAVGSLPRTQEHAIIQRLGPSTLVIGIDEAGRGPLAGPVVAAAALVPSTVTGICDSKKITKEDDRQELFNRLIDSPGVLYAAAVMDAPYIDQVNILKATLHGMALAAQAVMHMHQNATAINNNRRQQTLSPPPLLSHIQTDVSYHSRASSSIRGCYVVTNAIVGQSKRESEQTESTLPNANSFYALVDGNRLPPNMPCEAETMTKGDGREYSIGAASIVAKVIRDNLMREYHELYPEYNLEQHKGYPTAAHMALVRQLRAVTPIHRRTFQPLKSMEFDDEGKVVEPKN